MWTHPRLNFRSLGCLLFVDRWISSTNRRWLCLSIVCQCSRLVDGDLIGCLHSWRHGLWTRQSLESNSWTSVSSRIPAAFPVNQKSSPSRSVTYSSPMTSHTTYECSPTQVNRKKGGDQREYTIASDDMSRRTRLQRCRQWYMIEVQLMLILRRDRLSITSISTVPSTWELTYVHDCESFSSDRNKE